MSGILDNLTDPQRQAVTHMDGPMLVVAGAGSGKTRVVTRRIAYLISQGVRADQILAMTFTNKAAGEMKERVAALVGRVPPWVGTFHSICAKFLRRDLDRLGEGRTGRFTIYDEADQQELIKQCLKDLLGDAKGGEDRLTPRVIQTKISRAKCDMTPPEDLAKGFGRDETVAKTYEAYERKLRAMNAVDFDDLLILTARLLENVPELRRRYHQRFQYLLIDEYQDTNRTQYHLMRLLAGPKDNVHVTGDPDQSIYSWRGADYRNIMDFQKDFTNAKLVRLEQNYRSTKTILHAANVLIRHAENRIEKDLFTENPNGEKVTVAAVDDEAAEADWIAERVIELRGQGHKLSDVAVFYRTNAQSRPFEEALMRQAIPYQIVGGIRFYERKEIKDILAHLKILVNPSDVVSFRRIVACRPSGVGRKTVEELLAHSEREKEPIFNFLRREDFVRRYQGRTSAKLKAFADRCRCLGQIGLAPVASCVADVLAASGLIEHFEEHGKRDPRAQDRIENLSAFLNRAREFDDAHPNADLPAFLEDVALVADIDTWENGAEQLSLMTLHSAKGLEFPVVFVAGVEEGLLPHQNSQTKEALEEERRLFYVGITRAEQRLFITHAANRFTWGQASFSIPSTFLGELPDEALDQVDLSDAFDDFDRFVRPRCGGKKRRRQTKRRVLDYDDDFSQDADDD